MLLSHDKSCDPSTGDFWYHWIRCSSQPTAGKCSPELQREATPTFYSVFQLPWLQIGASGYAFVVDNNGQLVNHPAISQEFIEVE